MYEDLVMNCFSPIDEEINGSLSNSMMNLVCLTFKFVMI